MSKFYDAIEIQKFYNMSNPSLGFESFDYDYTRSIEFIQSVIFANSYSRDLREFETCRLGESIYSNYNSIVNNTKFNMITAQLEFGCYLTSLSFKFTEINFDNMTSIDKNKNNGSMYFKPLVLNFTDDNITNAGYVELSYNSKERSVFNVIPTKHNKHYSSEVLTIHVRFNEFKLDITCGSTMYKVLNSAYADPFMHDYAATKSIAFNKNKNILASCNKGMGVYFEVKVDQLALIHEAKKLLLDNKIQAVGKFFFPTSAGLDTTYESKMFYMFAKSVCNIYNVLFSNDLKNDLRLVT